MSVAAPFGVISNRIRETSYRFQLEMQMEYSLKKMHAFLPAGFCICDDPCFSKF